MSVYRTLAKLFNFTDPPGLRKDPGRTYDEGERLKTAELEDLLDDRCPDCKAKGGFEKGPEGGMSCNFRCPKCGSRFNALGPFGVDRISPKSPGPQTEGPETGP